MSHLSKFNAVGPLQRKYCRFALMDARSSIEKTCGSAHGCSVPAIAESELVRRIGKYDNVRRI